MNLWFKWLEISASTFDTPPVTHLGIAFHDQVSSFSYFAGCDRDEVGETPQEFTQLDIPRQTFLVFGHYQHALGLRETMEDIWGNRIPNWVELPDISISIQKSFGPPDPYEKEKEIQIFIPVKTVLTDRPVTKLNSHNLLELV